MKNLNKTNEQINRSIGQLVKQSDRAIAKLYAKTLNEIRRELTKYYEKFEQNGVLTYAEMARYDRLNKFMSEVDGLLKRHYKDTRGTIYRALGESYLDGYYITAWAIETDTMSKLGYSAVKPEVISKAINNPVGGLSLNHRLEKYRQDIVWKIQQEITEGLVKGEAYGTMSHRLKETFENDTAKAMRLVRTEAHRIKEDATLDSAKHANANGIIMKKKWVSFKDERTRSSHKALNGVAIPIDDEFVGKFGKGQAPGQLGDPKEDIHCRCFLTYTVEKVEKPNVKELENMTFEQWKKERLRGA